MVVISLQDIVGASAKVRIAPNQTGGTNTLKARRLFLTAINGTGARFGDYATITAGQGVSLPQNVEVTISASDADPVDLLDLYASGVYVPSGVTVTVAYAV